MSPRHAGHRLRNAIAVLLGLMALTLGSGMAAASDCGCSQTGGYKAPASNPVVATSSKYSVTATSTTVTVRRTETNAIVFERPRHTGAAWGFSPDGDRFVYQHLTGTTNNMHYVVLYDLGAKRSLKEMTTLTTTSRVVFSSQGKYMLYSAVVNSQTSLTVVDALTGAVSYQTQFTPYAPPGSPGDTFGLASWGFSPEAANRTFVFGRTTSQSTVQLAAINLISKQLVVDQTMGNGWWQFSPCGDALGVVSQLSQTNMEVSLYKTSARAPRFAGTTTSVATIALSTTAESHLVVVGGTTRVLAPNIADDPCSTISSVSVPSPVTGGETATATATLTSPAPPGGLVVTVASSNPAVAKPAVTSITVAEGKASATFSVDTFPTASQTAVTISGMSGTVTKTAALTVRPPVLSSVAVSPSTIAGGTPTTGTVSLTGKAPAGGLTVNLSSSYPAVAVATTSSVTVAANSTSADFPINTVPVPGDVLVTISAQAGTVTKSTMLTVRGSTLAINDVSVAEGDSGTKEMTFDITRSGDTSVSATVGWATVDYTAWAPSDYLAATGSVSFGVGEAGPKQVSVTINGDTTYEVDQRFVVRLSAASGTTIRDGDGWGTIMNDDSGVPAPQTFDYTIGDTVSDGVPAPGAGNIEVPGAMDVYRFTASANQQVFIDTFYRYSGCGVWELVDPAGAAVFNGWFCDSYSHDIGYRTLPLTGTYTLKVSEPYYGTTGTYGFRIS